MITKPKREIMLVKTAMVGNQGKKWHIARNALFTYCGAKPVWISNEGMEISEINHLCLNCKREWEKEGEL